MANKFVIDININGAEGSEQQRPERGAQSAASQSSMGAAALGGYASSKNKSPVTGRKAGGTTGYFMGQGLQGRHMKSQVTDYKANQAMPKNIRGRLTSPLTRDYGNSVRAETALAQGARVASDYTREHRNQIKTLGVAAAWKGASTAVDLKNYKSGDSYANQQRDNAMRLATMGAAIIATGGNPLVIGAMVGNEAVSAYADYQKYTFDRKMESQEIFNIKQIAGDVSYGINRRGGF